MKLNIRLYLEDTIDRAIDAYVDEHIPSLLPEEDWYNSAAIFDKRMELRF